ncbi:MAG TPA: sulfotransferase [Crocinitomicaceae bacterium]|nr:sulfotransferase [Crocinitomicaceae bacterium]
MTQTIIHIGFPKTGSTFLQGYFENNPLFYHDRNRFLNYYQTGNIDETVIRQTALNFDVLSEETLAIWAGKSTDDFKTYNIKYDIRKQQQKVAQQLYQLYPNAKILIVTRNYSSLIKALYSQNLFGGNYRSLKRFLKEDTDGISYLFNYDYVINCYQQLFGKENVIILPFEFLQENPKGFLNHIEHVFDFEHFDFSTDKIHSSLNSFSIPVIRVLNFLAINYIRFFTKKQNKHQQFLNYVAWLYDFKEKWMKNIKFGKPLKVPVSKLKINEFNQNCKLVKFEGKLSRFNKLYEN